jgi:hypothetical protein
MSDQLTLKDGTTVKIGDIDPAIVAHFQTLTKPLEEKRDELLGTVNSLKEFKKAIEGIGGIDKLKDLQTKAQEAAAKAEQERLGKLTADEKLAEIEGNYKREIQTRDERLSKWQSQAVKRAVEAALNDAVRADEGVPELLTHALLSRVEGSMDDDGNISIKVKGPNGQNLDDKGNAFTLKSLVSEFKANDTYAPAFKANPASGAGGRKSNAAVSSDNPFAKNTENVTKQMEMIKNQPELARSMASAAGIKPDW